MSKTTTWQCGMTTVPSRLENGLFQRTRSSLIAAGFPQFRLFVDGCNNTGLYKPYEQDAVSYRWPLIRAFANWWLGLLELYLRSPNADYYAMFQDDFVLCKGVRDYIEKSKFPPKSYLNLFTFLRNEKLVDKVLGWKEADPISRTPSRGVNQPQGGKGALALVFPNSAVKILVANQHFVNRVPDTERGHRLIDGAVVEIMNQNGFREYIHNPSLASHIGTKSAIFTERTWTTNAKSFPGEQFDVRHFLKEEEPVVHIPPDQGTIVKDSGELPQEITLALAVISIDPQPVEDWYRSQCKCPDKADRKQQLLNLARRINAGSNVERVEEIIEDIIKCKDH